MTGYMGEGGVIYEDRAGFSTCTYRARFVFRGYSRRDRGMSQCRDVK